MQILAQAREEGTVAGNQGACLHQPAWEVRTQAMGSGEVIGIPGQTPLVPSGAHRNHAL